MKVTKENVASELYLKTSTAAKPNMPLKLYANITAKSTIERELGEELSERIRGERTAAEKQKNERKVIVLDKVPAVTVTKTSVTKKSTFKTAAARKQAADHSRNLSSTSAGPAHRSVSPLPPPPPRPQKDPTLRGRLIHFLGLDNRTLDEIITLVGGPTGDKIELTDVFREV